MPRLVFKPGTLHNYISSARATIRLQREDLAAKLGVSGKTLADWQREKYFPDQDKLNQLSILSGLPIPTPIEIREDWWSCRVHSSIGAKAKYKKYGCSLTLEDRVKGGHNSQVARKENPEYYRSLGCNMRNQFTFPPHNFQFAELIGILLGDGHISKNGQFTITLNSIKDKQYSTYVVRLITTLFGYEPSLYPKKHCHAITICLTGKDVVDFLIKSGMKIGNKVKQQVDVPGWIKANPTLSRWCVRGLIDTDGGIFTNSYIINGKSYAYPKTNFTNASEPLLDFVYQTLKNNGFHPNKKQPRKIWLYSQVESKKYLKVIGSSNERLLKKI